MTLYIKLLTAAQNRDADWNNYESDCHRFIGQFRETLVEYLECDDSEVILPRYAKDNELEQTSDHKIVKTPPYRTMILLDDAFWRFTFRLLTSKKLLGIYVIHAKGG